MIKNIFLLLNFILFTQPFSTQPILTLLKTCANKFIYDELDEESKKAFNEFIQDKNLDPNLFNLTGETIRDHDYSYMYLKGFNFTNARLNNINFKNAILTDTTFHNTLFEDVDFYGTDLSHVKFTHCRFIRCNLEKTDLSQTTLKQCKFKKVKLHGAKLHQDLPFDENISHLKLVHLYAEFIQKGEKDKAAALNKLFGVLKLKLIPHTELRELDLTGIDLSKADLSYAKLPKVCLSDQLVLPDYQADHQLVFLYDQFIRNKQTEKAETLNKVLGRLHLDLRSINLRNLDLRGINLSKGNLRLVNLTNTNLTGANLKYTNLNTPFLNGVILSETCTLHFNNLSELFYQWKAGGPNKPFYQKLVNAQVPLFENVPYEDLKQADWKGQDLRNANFNSLDLEGCDFTDANLKNADLSDTNLVNAILTRANLKKASLSLSALQGANLKESDLKKASLNDAELNEAWLSDDLLVDYNEHPKELFQEWAKNDIYRPLYQKLINAQVEIISDIPEEDLQKVSWKRINLNNSCIKDCTFSNIDFMGCDFRTGYFQNIVFNHCCFGNVSFGDNLCGAEKWFIFNSCSFPGTVFNKLNMSSEFNQCTFKNIKVEQLVSKCYHSDHKVYSGNLMNYYFQIADPSERTLFNAFLQGFKLNLNKKDLRGLNLEGLDLSGADLRGARLSIDDLTTGRWNSIKLSDSFTVNKINQNSNISDLIMVLGSRGVLIDQEEIKNDEPPLKKIKLEND